ncbi:MAG: SurA N-terminal domain-containing protein [Prevotellaceae bacterium]|jgi:peptidyl-prolyl cis-trans isomerase D|nr:SurA N-terminal domain-containing protein [Prevotellaceae bacterium]
MAVLESLRNKAGVLLVGIIGLALLSFVLGDLFGNSGGGGGLFSSSNDVGKINGHKVSYEEYQQTVDYFTSIYLAMYGQNATNEAVTEEIREQAWQALVRKYLYDKVYDDVGIQVSSDELFDLIQGRNPSPLVIRNFSNPQTGEFDRGYMLRYLQNIEQNPDAKLYWLFLEKEIITQRKQTKLMGLAAKAMYVTSVDAKNTFDNGAKTVSIQYVSKPLTSYPDSLIKITSRDVKKYYQAHKPLYKQNASRDLELALFPIAPSEEDDKAASSWIENLAPEFKNATDVVQFTTLHSDVPFDAVYHKKGELPELLDSFAFSSGKSDMLGPVLDDGVYKMARIADARLLPDSVKAQHILLDISKGMDATRKTADSIRTALQKGANFTELATKYSIDQAANEKGGDLGWFAQNSMVKPFGDSCFFAPKGRVLVVETQFGVHVVEVTDKGKPEKKVQLAVVERTVEPSRTTRERIFSSANELATQSIDRATFAAKSDEKGYTRRPASRITINDKSVAGLQQARELVRWAYNSKEDAISPIFEIDNNFVVATLTAVRKDGYAPVKQVASEISAELLREKKAAAIAEEMKGADDLNSLAERLNLSVQTLDNINFSSFYLPNVGVEPKLAAAASASKENQISGPVEGSSGVYVFVVTSVTSNAAADENLLAQEKSRQQASLPMRLNYELFETLRVEADIKDQRGKIY